MNTDKLILSDNSKVKFRPNHRNTFGLNFGLPENGGTCSGATLGKGGCLDVQDGHKRPTCYMAKITQIYKGVGPILQTNTDMLRGKTIDEMVVVLTNTFQEFKNKNKQEYWYFRSTFSGDFFSEDFARAFAIACKKFPEVQFWLYTRSHQFVEILSDAPNAAIYISVDPCNKDAGLAVYEKLKDRKNVGIAMMSNKEELCDIRFTTCPEISGKLHNTKNAGACSKCRLCFRYSSAIKLRPIRFPIH